MRTFRAGAIGVILHAMSSTKMFQVPPATTPTGKWIRRLWIGAAAGIVGVILFFILIAMSGLPDFEQLENPEFEKASRVYDNQRQEIGRYYTQNRVPVFYEELNPFLVQALIATEDERFFRHSGVDLKALGRVAFGVVTMNSNKGGGSTITQQLAKLLFDRPDFSGMNKLRRQFSLVITKFKEWITAIKIERQYTKEEILAMYLNKFNFIYGAYGIRAASEIYFGKPQDELNIEECATLIGMLKNPALFNPIRRPDTVAYRRMIVLNQMRDQGHITRAEYDSLKVLPLDMSRFRMDSHAEGPAPYFRMELAKWLRTMLDRPEYRKPDGSKYNIYRDGLKIYTTIDLEMQQIAEEEMYKHMAKVQERFNTVWKNRDPWTHQADAVQKQIRQAGLKSLIRSTGRYQDLRLQVMGDVLSRIATDADYEPSDWDIETMLEEEKKEGRFAQLVARKTITKERAARYRKVMSSQYWDGLKNAWTALAKEEEKVFNTPVRMRIFDYATGDKEVTMSPLDSIMYHRKILQTGILAIDPRTGYIKTWVGGVNHKYFQFDHIQTSRQVGSTFKPFVYATAIALQGFSPCFPVVDQPYTIGPGDGSFGLIAPWTPQNADGAYSMNTYTLYDCLRQSKNTCSVYLMQQLGNANVVRGLIHNMGIDSSLRRSDGEYRVPRQPSICLGSADLSVMEMTGAYATFANNGLYNKPAFVLSIEDENGREIYRHVTEEVMALPAKANYVLLDMLRYAGTNLGGITCDVGGKTGTTNDYVDGWFIGVTPSLVVGTWVGGEDPWIRFLSLSDGQGSVMAKPFFRSFILRLQESKDVDFEATARFVRPTGEMEIETDCSRYKAIHSGRDVDEFQETRYFEDEFIDNR